MRCASLRSPQTSPGSRSHPVDRLPTLYSIKSGDYDLNWQNASGAPPSLTIRHRDRPTILTFRLLPAALSSDASPLSAPLISVERTGAGTRLTLTFRKRSATFRDMVEIYRATPGLIRFRIEMTSGGPVRLADPSPEFLFKTARDRLPATGGATIYKQQAGLEAPLAYLYSAEMDSTLVYLQNLTSLNPYLNQVQGDPRYCVRLDAGGLGFHRPPGTLPGRAVFTLNDSFLWLQPGRPADDISRSRLFIQAVSNIYDRLQKPVTRYTDWPFRIAPQAAKDLLDPINGIETHGTHLLRSYVGRQQTEPESICNLDVLIAARRYARMFEADQSLARLIADIERGLPDWYLPIGDRHTVSNNFSVSTEIDSWYYIYPILQTAELALDGDAEAKAMTLGSAPKLIELAHVVEYEFPFILNAENGSRVNDSFREYDTLGGFAYVMLTCYQFTHEATYLDEAKRAVGHIDGKGFKFTYETQLTGATLESLAWLYQITSDPHYIDLSYVPLANLLSLTWLWNPGYGYAASYSLFLGNNPLPTADQVAAFELHNVWGSLRRYYLRAERALPGSVRKLVAEIVKYQITVARSTLPPFLPAEALCRAPDWGVVRPDMMIPVEDLKDGFHPSATVGQEIYGCGLPFQFAAEAYQTFGDHKEIALYSEYPVTSARWSTSASRLTFRLGGTPDYRCRVRLLLLGRWSGADRQIKVRTQSPEPSGAIQRGQGYFEFQAAGGNSYEISISKTSDRKDRRRPLISPQSGLSCRIAAILGAGGIVQAQAGGTLFIPVVVSNPTRAPVSYSVAAGLPEGWRLLARASTIPPQSSITRRVALSIPAAAPVDSEHPIVLSIGSARRSVPLLSTVVRVIAPATVKPVADFILPAFWSAIDRQKALLKAAEGVTLFTTTADGFAGFETLPITIDMDSTPDLDIDVASLDDQWAMTVQEVGAPYGSYIVPDTARAGDIRVPVRDRTGWSGLHTFTLRLFVVGKKNASLRLRSLRFVSKMR